MLRRVLASLTPPALGLALLAPWLALCAAALLDVGPGPDFPVRLSLFPMVLAAYDTLTATSFVNSLGVAAMVTCGSLCCGVALARVLVRWRFWARPLFACSLIAPAVIPPAYLALGAAALFDPAGPVVWRRLSHALLTATTADQSWPWAVWIWAAIVQGSALVVVAASSALGSLDPDREDAARLIGASSRQLWWTLTWPLVRPAIALVLNIIFIFTLADPGPPLILGLRRTVGFQLVFSSNQPDPFPRIAAICLFVMLIALAWRRLVRAWARAGGVPALLLAGKHTSSRPGVEAGWLRAAVCWALLSVASVLAWLPVAGLVISAAARDVGSTSIEPLSGSGLASFLHRLGAESSWSLVSHTVLLGLGVALVLWTLLSWRSNGPLAWPQAEAKPPGPRFAALAVAPPLVVGVAVLALSRMAELGALWFRTLAGWPALASPLEVVGRMIDPCGAPGVAVYLGVCLAYLPTKLLARRTHTELNPSTTHRIDQAMLAGAGRRRARALGLRGPENIAGPMIVLWSVLAAMSVAPAIVLAPTMESRTIGPGIVVLADGDEELRSQAAALALGAVAVDLAALSWYWAAARRGRKGPPLHRSEYLV